MEGRKKKHGEQQQQKEHKTREDPMKKWLGPDDAVVDFSDTAPSPCKDFYHVFVNQKEVDRQKKLAQVYFTE